MVPLISARGVRELSSRAQKLAVPEAEFEGMIVEWHGG
jgi:hypothetical protein